MLAVGNSIHFLISLRPAARLYCRVTLKIDLVNVNKKKIIMLSILINNLCVTTIYINC